MVLPPGLHVRPRPPLCAPAAAALTPPHKPHHTTQTPPPQRKSRHPHHPPPLQHKPPPPHPPAVSASAAPSPLCARRSAAPRPGGCGARWRSWSGEVQGGGGGRKGWEEEEGWEDVGGGGRGREGWRGCGCKRRREGGKEGIPSDIGTHYPSLLTPHPVPLFQPILQCPLTPGPPPTHQRPPHTHAPSPMNVTPPHTQLGRGSGPGLGGGGRLQGRLGRRRTQPAAGGPSQGRGAQERCGRTDHAAGGIGLCGGGEAGRGVVETRPN